MAEIVTASVQANSEVITATLTSGSEQMTAVINVAARGPMGPVGSAAWGSITGTLSTQTDLQTALNLKAPLASPTFTGIVTAPRITGRCDGLEVLCKAGLAINAGQVVYVTGASGNNIVIGLARANAEATSSKTLGISESTLANNATGYVITEGLMTVSISAPSANEGDPIWLSPTTAGSMVFGLANKPSAPNHIVYLGVVTRKTGNTVVEIYVKVQNGAELDELSDVAITSAVAGQALMRGATLWENRSLVIADISDATTSVPFLAAASNTFTGLTSFTSTTRPTAPNVTGTPAATSLMTRDDVDAAEFDNFGRTFQVIGATFGNTGASSSAQSNYPSYIADIRTGATANAYARASINRSLSQAVEITGGGINFSLPSAIAVRLMLNLSDTIHKLRLVVGGNGGVPATADNDALAVVGYGFEIGLNASNFVTIASFRHNGTTYVKATPTVTTFTNSTVSNQFFTLVLTNNGSGTITTEMKSGRTVLFTSTQTGGPTTSGILANSYVDLVAVNGASSAAQLRCSLQNAMIRPF